MAFSLDDKPLTITCPKCGEKIEKTIGWFKADGRNCPFCGTGFDTTQFRRELEKVEAETEKTFRQIRKSLGRKIEIKL